MVAKKLTTERRYMISAEITGDSFNRVKELSASLEMRQKVLIGRILDWFAELPQIEQMVVTGTIPQEDRQILSDLLIRRRIVQLGVEEKLA